MILRVFCAVDHRRNIRGTLDTEPTKLLEHSTGVWEFPLLVDGEGTVVILEVKTVRSESNQHTYIAKGVTNLEVDIDVNRVQRNISIVVGMSNLKDLIASVISVAYIKLGSVYGY